MSEIRKGEGGVVERIMGSKRDTEGDVNFKSCQIFGIQPI